MDLINQCDSRLERCHEYLENIGRREVAQDIGIVLNDLYRLRQHYDLLVQQHEATVRSLRKEVASQRVIIENERIAKDDARKLAQQSYRRVNELATAIALKDTSIGQLNDTVASKNSSIAKLNKDLDREKANTKAAYINGFNAGQQAAKKPPMVKKPEPDRPVIDVMLRQSWLNNLMLTPTTASTMSSSLKKALILGDKQTVASVLAREPLIGAPALHMAALFGDVEVAKLLVARGVPVNGICDAQSEKFGQLVHGVTPMHLAIGAQHGDMVRYLHSVGGTFFASDAGRGKRSSAPPLWLISKRWLNMVGDDPKRIVSILRTMKKLGWNTNASLNEGGDTMRSLARKNLSGRIELQSAVLAELDRIP